MNIENIAQGSESTNLMLRLSQNQNFLDSNIQGQSEVSGNFASWLGEEISAVNDQIHKSQALVQDLAVGKTDNIHHVMMSLEKTKLQFELVVQVRNKLLEGYQEIMRMQV